MLPECDDKPVDVLSLNSFEVCEAVFDTIVMLDVISEEGMLVPCCEILKALDGLVKPSPLLCWLADVSILLTGNKGLAGT